MLQDLTDDQSTGNKHAVKDLIDEKQTLSLANSFVLI